MPPAEPQPPSVAASEERRALSAGEYRFIRRAVALGRRGWGRVQPNPLVGCVLVRDGIVVGEGWHAEWGGPHAEVEAIRDAGGAAVGATAYVSLEPCRHHGKTPPCTSALREAGVRRVVYGAPDPGPQSGGGGAELRAAGVHVIGPVLSEQEATWENPVFFHSEPDRPWLALKLAISMDGMIAARPGERTVISGPESLAETHRLRAGFDAILVGTKTAVVDNPLLTVRGEVQPRLPPARIILDATGRTTPRAKIFREGDGPVRVITTPGSREDWRANVRDAGADLIEVPANRAGRVELPEAFEALRREEVASVLCEGGGKLGVALWREGLVDRLYLTMAPRVLGSSGVPAFPFDPDEGPYAAHGGHVPGWVLGEDPRRIGEDIWMAFEPDPR